MKIKEGSRKADCLFLVVVIVVSVLLFGSVESWAAGLVGSAIVIYFNVRLYGFFIFNSAGSGPGAGQGVCKTGRAAVSWQGAMVLSAAGFFLLVLLELAPLPPVLIRALRPQGYGLIGPFYSPAWHWRCLSVNAYETLLALIRFVIYCLVFLMAAHAGSDRRALKGTLSVLSLFGFALTMFAITQKSAGNGRIYWVRELREGGSMFGPFVNRDHFAGFMGMVFPLPLALALEARRMQKRAFYLFLALICAIGIIYSLSRGGIISFFISGLFFFFLAKRRGRGKPALYLTAFSAALLLCMLYFGLSPVMDRFGTEGLSPGTRFQVWGAALRAAWDFRWTGTGLGTFRDIFPLYNPGIQRVFDFAHNDYINLAVETGLPGLFIALVFFACFARGTYNYIKRYRTSFLTAGLVASVTYMLVHSFFDFNLHIPSNAITFAVIAGFAASRISNPHAPEVDP